MFKGVRWGRGGGTCSVNSRVLKTVSVGFPLPWDILVTWIFVIDVPDKVNHSTTGGLLREVGTGHLMRDVMS